MGLNPEQPASDPPRLWAIRALYFFFFAGAGIYFTFINVYYRSLGLSGFQIGIINTLAPMIGIFGSLLWGMLSDRFGKIRLLLMAAALGAAVTSLGIGAARTFAWILPLAGVYSLFSSTIIPLLDSSNFAALGEHKDRYGLQRIWGTIGFTVTSSTVGLVLEKAGLHFLFVLYPLTMLALFATAFGLRSQPIRLGASIFTGIGRMVRQREWLFFAASVFLLVLGSNGMSNFLGIAMKDMGAGDWTVGVVWTMSSLSELPVMFFGAYLVRRLGAPRMLALAYLFYIVRISLYSLMPVPEWALWINLLHSCTYGLFWIGGVTYANDLAPAHLKATSQSLLLVIMNISAAVGSPFSGWLYDKIGKHMFLVGGGFALAAWLVFLAGQLVGHKKTRVVEATS
jgi:MFS transporter, PPP family, 3-phenylpropionic acid transporter